MHKPGAPVPVPFTDVAVTVRRSRPVRRAAFGLGGNVGDVEASLRRAVGQLADSPLLDVVAVSDLYRTAPVGGPEQPDFLNAVVTVDTGRCAVESPIARAGDRVLPCVEFERAVGPTDRGRRCPGDW